MRLQRWVVFGDLVDYDGGGRLVLLRDWTWCTLRHVLTCRAFPTGGRHVVWVFRSRWSAQRAINHYGTKPADRRHMTPVRIN